MNETITPAKEKEKTEKVRTILFFLSSFESTCRLLFLRKSGRCFCRLQNKDGEEEGFGNLELWLFI